MSDNDPLPVLTCASKETNNASSMVPVSKENKELPVLRDKLSMVDRSKPLPTSLESSFVPKEIFVALTSAANPSQCPTYLRPPKKTKSIKDVQGCIRTVDGVWQHPVRRNKFQYMIEHPICLTGAGRDVSFLYDVISAKEKNPPPTPVRRKTSTGTSTGKTPKQEAKAAKPPTSLADSLIPEEFHVIKNRGVMGLEYYDDKYTTLLEDHENRLRVFPSMKPSGRLEVVQLMKVMDSMLEKAGVDNEETGVTGLSQMHSVLEVLKMEQNVYNIVFHEIIRQVSVDCAERGELLSKLRQRYVELLDRIPKQMRNLYKEMMAQRVMDKHITDELSYFKEAIEQLTRELQTIREHDRRTSVEAKKAFEELAEAVRDSEMNANLLDEYRELYELQRARLEDQIHQLTQEKELWSSTTYELALKVIEKNKLILARKMYSSEKTWTKLMKHFIVLLASEDTADLSNLQHLTQEFREILSRIGTIVVQAEETSKENLNSIHEGLARWQNYFQDHVLEKGSFSSVKGTSLLDQVLVDLKVWEKMLNEELEQYGGEVNLTRRELLKTASDLQKQWMELGIAVLRRHKDLNGLMPPELKMLEDIIKNASNLCHQYSVRINGENGVTRILTSLVNSLEDWTFKMLSNKQGLGMRESDWIKFVHVVSDWLAQMEDLLKFIGCNDTPDDRKLRAFPVVPEELFKKIQQWILTTTSGAERENIQLAQEMTDFHNTLSKWMASLLMHMVPDHTSCESLPLTKEDIERQAENKLLNIFKLEGEAISLAAKLSKFSTFIVSCCKEMVSSITRRKLSVFDPNAGRELHQLEMIKTECLDWINTCNLLLSEMKTSPTSLISTEELINLFGKEAFHLRHQLPPHPEHDADSLDETVEPAEESKEDEETGAKKAVAKKQELETEKQPSSSTDLQAAVPEIVCPVRYIGHDANVYVRSIKEEEISVSGRELYVSQWRTKYSRKEFEMLASLEILEERLIEAEKRAQKAEEKSESLHDQLEEALAKLQDIYGETPKLKTVPEEAVKPEPEVTTKEKPSASSQPAHRKSTPRSKKSKPKH